jgi:hypothetical protein
LIEIFQSPNLLATKFFGSQPYGDEFFFDYLFLWQLNLFGEHRKGEPLTRAFQKHITWAPFLAIKKIWSLFNNSGLFHGDYHLKIAAIIW